MNAVKAAMAAGRTLVLLNFDDIYESLYDVLNRRFVTRVDPKTGRAQSCLRLAIGARSHLCPVAPSFKVVVIAEEEHALANLDLPLLNRFEKMTFGVEDVLSPRGLALARALREWCELVASQSGLGSVEAAFCAAHVGLVPSLVHANDAADLGECKRLLAALLTPEAVVTSPAAKEVVSLE